MEPKEGAEVWPTRSRTSEEFSEKGEEEQSFFVDEALDELEDELLEESEAYEEEEEEIEEYYDTKEFISRPYVSPNADIPEDIVEFDYSYGYDCQRFFNLCVVDKVILIFASGNIIHFFDTSTGKKWYRRCSSGRGIGHITINPVDPHIAVAEKGDEPLIIIYEWPSFEIVTVLKKGTTTAYTFVDYSPDGELLCSQGDKPDYMLTIWNWRKQKIMLRCKAYGSKVYNSRFSSYVPNSLTTSGTTHIKFWKINNTFTGLKLIGELGRFGKSEICNIIGFLALPDEKVISGCEWGNILVWDGGLIRVEVSRRGRNTCHDAPITQLIYNNGDLTTVAMDGTIKVWYYETIELADPPEEEKFIEVEPIFEYEVGDYYHKAKLLVIVKANPAVDDDHLWYGQDGNGGIWKLDLSMTFTADPPVLIFQCHAGGVAAIQCSPCSPHFASLGEDGRLFIYDYETKQMILKKEFLAGGCSLLWLPLAVEESGCLMIGGFSDGVIRVICVSLYEFNNNEPFPYEDYINLVQVIKPHAAAVTVVTINPKFSIVVTGSKDCTIFVHQIKEGPQFPTLVPIGFVSVPGEVTHCTWKPRRDSTILVSCENGTFAEIDLPTEPETLDPVSYQLSNVEMQTHQFVSIKGELIRNQRLDEIEKDRKTRLKEREMYLRMAVEETGIPLEEEAIQDALKEETNFSEIEIPEVYVPKDPNPILFATYTSGKAIWLSMGGFDAGYVYHYEFQEKHPVFYRMVPDADGIEITCHHYYHNQKYLILGMKDGQIRVVKLNPSDEKDLSKYWSFPMHDNDNGTIRGICFNYDYSYMFTCGDDGNVFSYKFSPSAKEYKNVNLENVISKGYPKQLWPDIDDINALSLEQTKNKIEYDERMKEANAYKRDLTEILKGLEKRFEVLLRRNSKLPKSQQLSGADLELDERVINDLNFTLEEEMSMVKFKTEWQLEKSRIQHEKVENYLIKSLETHTAKVYGIEKQKIFAQTFRVKALGQEFEDMKDLVKFKLEEQEAQGRGQAKAASEEELVDTITKRPNPVEGLVKQIMVFYGDYEKNIKLRRLLRKYRQRKDRLESRRVEWYEMNKKKPSPEKPDSDDMTSIRLAKENIGNYQLKTAPDFKPPTQDKTTTVSLYSQLLNTVEEVYSIKKSYNDKVLELRERKLVMIERHEHLRELLLEIAKEIPSEKIRNPPNLPTYVEEVEFPEKKFSPNEMGVFEELPKRFRALYKSDQPKKKEIKLLDQEYEMLILEKTQQKFGKVHSRLPLMKFLGITGSRDIKELEDAGKDDKLITPWEKEFKKLRVAKRLFEQDRIIDEMETTIKQFDDDIIKLNELSYETEINIKLLELHQLTLFQEVLILKKFEAAEMEKESKLLNKLWEKHVIQKRMNELNNKVEGRNREIRRCEEEIKNIITVFHAATAENKFYDYLKRIFKKKYKPPKTKSEDSDSESESESSESSEEEDVKSLDSKDFGLMRLDESLCPPGCDPNLFEWTFVQRSGRHALESNIMEEKKLIEWHKKEYDGLHKKLKNVVTQFNACQNDLEEYVREKQRNLNEVETVVILRLNQVQNFKSESEIEKISESIVFSATRLTNLYKRVGELEKETQMERQKHEKNRQHLTRMKVDVNHMKGLIVNLTQDIDEAMIKKFGMKVDLDDIEESLLKRLVAEMHSIVLDLEKGFQKKIKSQRELLMEKENEYAQTMQDNTEKFNLLTALYGEKINIRETIQRQEKLICAQSVLSEEEQDAELENLRKLVNMQEEKIEELKQEIGGLKLKEKPKPLPSVEITDFMHIEGKKLDEETEEVDYALEDEIKDMYEEAMEIVLDVKDGKTDEEDLERMKMLTKEIIQVLPDKCKMDVIRRLCKSNTTGQPLSRQSADIFLKGVLTSLQTDTFMEAMGIVKEAIDSVLPQLGSGDFKQ